MLDFFMKMKKEERRKSWTAVLFETTVLCVVVLTLLRAAHWDGLGPTRYKERLLFSVSGKPCVPLFLGILQCQTQNNRQAGEVIRFVVE